MRDWPNAQPRRLRNARKRIRNYSARHWASLIARTREYTSRAPRVCTWCMARIRTNIEIDDVYLRRIMDRYGIHTKTEAVDLALRHRGRPAHDP